MLTRDALAEAAASGRGDVGVDTLLLGEPLRVYPDQAAEIVVERVVAAAGLVPVVNCESLQDVLGVVTLGSLAGAVARRSSSAAAAGASVP